MTGVFTLFQNNPLFSDAPQSSLNNSNSGIIALLDAVMVQKQSLPALQNLLFLLWIKIGHHDLIAVKAAKREFLYKLSFFFGIIGQKAKLQNLIPVIQIKYTACSIGTRKVSTVPPPVTSTALRWATAQ